MRKWEIDSLKGIAIILVVAFHLFFDLHVFKDIPFSTLTITCWNYLGRIAATLFIMLSGVSLTLNYHTTRSNFWFYKMSIRAGKLLLIAASITLVTRMLFPEEYIIFGILHFLAVASAIGYILVEYIWLNSIFGILLLALGYALRSLSIHSSYFIWLGLTPPTFASLDYFPLIPWLGVYIFGIALGNLVYPYGSVRYILPDYSHYWPIKFLVLLGRYTLLLYIIHQPLFFALLTYI